MQRTLGVPRLLRRIRAIDAVRDEAARQQPCNHAANRLHPFYPLHMRNAPKPKVPTWAEYVLQARTNAKLSQRALAAKLGVDRVTVWRWENENRRPESAELAVKVADVTHTVRELALAAAGLGMPDDPADEHGLALRGLDPGDPVVQNILSLDISNEERDVMLKRRAEIVALRLAQDLRELELMARRDDRPSK